MKRGWLALLLLPIILFGKQEERGFFFTIEQVEEEALQNLALEEEGFTYPFGEISPEEVDSQGLSFLEMDERDSSLALWSEELLASDEKTHREDKKVDEVFSYELPSSTKPDLENVPHAQKYLIQINGPTP